MQKEKVRRVLGRFLEGLQISAKLGGGELGTTYTFLL